jgi:hypothetical protein
VSARLVSAASALAERRVSRRGLLSRMALGGSALVVAPLRYLLRPGTAWAVLRPEDCRPGTRCADGYTAFCCQIQHGANQCPPHSYVAGWWKCTDYKGRGLCGAQGFRYYIDCNRRPGEAFPGGCRCAGGTCGQRRVSCNRFRYGQCNTQVAGKTEVVCRVVVCSHPATVSGFNCNRTLKVDDRTCTHSAGCLKDVVVELPGGGGV